MLRYSYDRILINLELGMNTRLYRLHDDKYFCAQCYLPLRRNIQLKEIYECEEWRQTRNTFTRPFCFLVHISLYNSSILNKNTHLHRIMSLGTFCCSTVYSMNISVRKSNYDRIDKKKPLKIVNELKSCPRK